MIIQFKSINFFPLIVSLIIVLTLVVYRRFINSKVDLIIDLRRSPNIGYYSLCSASFIWRAIDISKEFSSQKIFCLADAIYIAKPELKYTFPERIHAKIVVEINNELIL